MPGTVNQIEKGDDGAVYLTEDEDKLRRWTAYGQEVAILVREYEHPSVLRDTDSREFHHHDETSRF